MQRTRHASPLLLPSPIGRGAGGEGTGTRQQLMLASGWQIADGVYNVLGNAVSNRSARTLTPTPLPEGEGLDWQRCSIDAHDPRKAA
jgi:hypothetical protein